MSDELNQDVSSPPPTTEGTNDPGKPSEPVATGMTDSQSSDYFNKTQQLAQDRRDFETDKADLEKQKQDFTSQSGQGAQFNQPLNQQPVQQQPQGKPLGYQIYQQLSNAIGEDAAESLLGQQQQQQNLSNQQIQQLATHMDQLEYNSIIRSLDEKGSRVYSESWKEKGQEVMTLVKQFPGMKLEQAWNAVNGTTAKQDGIDQAYKNQEVKENANVGSQQVQPQTAQADVNSVEDAVAAAMTELGG